MEPDGIAAEEKFLFGEAPPTIRRAEREEGNIGRGVVDMEVGSKCHNWIRAIRLAANADIVTFGFRDLSEREVEYARTICVERRL